MIGRWRALPPTKILHKYVDELEKRVEQYSKDIDELRWEKKAIIEQIRWLKERIRKENGSQERSDIQLPSKPSKAL